MKKIYQVIIQDEYNNLYQLGFYNCLKNAVKDVNEFIKVYNVQIKEDDLKEYPSTFDNCFDLSLSDLFEDNDNVANVMIRGFILDKERVIENVGVL